MNEAVKSIKETIPLSAVRRFCLTYLGALAVSTLLLYYLGWYPFVDLQAAFVKHQCAAFEDDMVQWLTTGGLREGDDQEPAGWMASFKQDSPYHIQFVGTCKDFMYRHEICWNLQAQIRSEQEDPEDQKRIQIGPMNPLLAEFNIQKPLFVLKDASHHALLNSSHVRKLYTDDFEEMEAPVARKSKKTPFVWTLSTQGASMNPDNEDDKSLYGCYMGPFSSLTTVAESMRLLTYRSPGEPNAAPLTYRRTTKEFAHVYGTKYWTLSFQAEDQTSLTLVLSGATSSPTHPSSNAASILVLLFAFVPALLFSMIDLHSCVKSIREEMGRTDPHISPEDLAAMRAAVNEPDPSLAPLPSYPSLTQRPNGNPAKKANGHANGHAKPPPASEDAAPGYRLLADNASKKGSKKTR